MNICAEGKKGKKGLSQGSGRLLKRGTNTTQKTHRSSFSPGEKRVIFSCNWRGRLALRSRKESHSAKVEGKKEEHRFFHWRIWEKGGGESGFRTFHPILL